MQLIETLKKQKTQLENQLSSAQSAIAKKEFKLIINLIDKKIAYIESKIASSVEGNQLLTENVKLLTSITGIGKLTAYYILAYLPDIKLFQNAKQLAAFIGLNPKQLQSGKFTGQTHISKLGNSHLRKILYMPALVAKNYNVALNPFVERLKKNGLAPKEIICAVMRKLVHIIFGILKSRSPFDPKLV